MHIFENIIHFHICEKNYGAYKHHMSKLIKFHSKTRNWLLENFEHNYWELSDHVYEKFGSAAYAHDAGDRSATELGAAASSTPAYPPRGPKRGRARRGCLLVSGVLPHAAGKTEAQRARCRFRLLLVHTPSRRGWIARQARRVTSRSMRVSIDSPPCVPQIRRLDPLRLHLKAKGRGKEE